MTVSVNVVVLAGTIAADPVERRMPSGEECTELRLSVPDPGRRLLPLPVVAWHAELGRQRLRGLAKGDEVLVYGRLARRFYRSGAGARSLTEVVASGIRRLEHPEPDRDEERDKQGPARAPGGRKRRPTTSARRALAPFWRKPWSRPRFGASCRSLARRAAARRSPSRAPRRCASSSESATS